MLQRKLDYVLHKLRLLEEIIVAEPGQCVSTSSHERNGVTRRALHVMLNRGSYGRKYLSRASIPAVETVANS
ncbi:hypothetical protein PsorP6_017707 [Peronosclerospora sorghi]|uniref:Uncharacterized protein n=1 Tax=Peronosclerospora sorghi TaxID=230839 RepID=A0ACC0WMJ3_9STRA|nr:hypothetical protein PsorP6_017707 [Peronosclerospora sorghi]